MSVFDWHEDPLTDEEILVRGRRAREILADPVFQGAVEEVERALLVDWYRGTTTAEREAIHAQITSLGAIRNRLRAYAEDAELMERRL